MDKEVKKQLNYIAVVAWTEALMDLAKTAAEDADKLGDRQLYNYLYRMHDIASDVQAHCAEQTKVGDA